MRRLIRTLLACAAVCMSGAAPAQASLDYESVWHCDQAKFNWYCDEEEQAREDARRKAAAVKPAAKDKRAADTRKRIEIADIKTAEQFRQEIQRRMDVAQMDPTDANMKDMIALNGVMQQKGAMFADAWRRIVWQNPEFDYSLQRPVNNAAIKVFDAQKEQHTDQKLRELASEHGLIFFFRSDCPYCHAMAPVVKMLQDKYGIEVLPVSIDGRGMSVYPNPRDGRTQAAAWGVERVPALFIGSKKTGDKAAIGFGSMALTEIVDRIFVLTSTKPGESF